MESEARYALVGAGLLILLLLLGGALYWLRGGDGAEVRRYVVYFQNQSLEGLQLNSPVRMQGIKVGKVVDYLILPNQAKTVRVLLEVDARTPVLEGVRAVIARNLVTGLAAVSLNNPGDGGAPLRAVPAGEKYPVINEGEADMVRFARTVEGLGQSGQEALDRVNRLLSDANQRAIGASLGEFAGLAGELRRDVATLTPALAATLEASRRAAHKLEGLGDELGPVLREGGQTLQRAGERLDSLAGEAEVTLKSTRATLGSLDAGLREMRMELRLSADLGLQEIQHTAQALRVAGESLQTTSRDFADPERILFGPSKGELGPGER